MEYIIEKGIELPSPMKERSGKGNSKYPLKEMEVGDSFIVGEYCRRLHQSMQGYANQYGKKWMNGARFTARLVKDNKLRCWRVK